MRQLLLGCLLLAGCAQQPIIPPPLDLPKKVTDHASTLPGAPALDGASATRVGETPKPPPPDKLATGKPAPKAPPAAEEAADITLSFEQVPLPTFIQAVYGTILKKNVNIDTPIMERKDLVTLRTGGPQTPSQVESAAQMLLKSYGIAVVDIGGLVRIVPDDKKLGYLPEIRRGRALPDTPKPLRPIFQLVELQAVRNTDIASWLKTMFDKKVDVKEDTTRNAVLLSGKSDDVLAAMEAIQVLDQPLMKGRHSVRIEPLFWSVDELAKRLNEILQAEGYSTGSPAPGSSITPAISLLPVAAVNALFAFSGSPKILEHIVEWAKSLDTASERSSGRSLFSYKVQYTDAESLAHTLRQLLAATDAPAAAAGQAGVPAAGQPAAAARSPAAGRAAPRAGAGQPAATVRTEGGKLARVVVDQATNTLIFQGYNEDYGQIRTLLKALDRPAPEALIEVTVAEVTLSDNTQLGIEWLAREANLPHGRSASYGTKGGLSLGTAGFNFRLLDSIGEVRLVLNALASSNRATILSSPRVVARNGETATIQVGQEVPIITSQQTTPTTGGTGSILQSIQYRNTGVILNVRPVIHSGDRVELDVSQEVSAAQSTTTGVANSPTFGTRKVQTRLSLKNGATVLLGGLISSNSSEGDAGIPLLKEIPLLGQLFRTNTDKRERTELIVLITPYVIYDDGDAEAITDAFRKRLGPWAQPPVPPAPEKE